MKTYRVTLVYTDGVHEVRFNKMLRSAVQLITMTHQMQHKYKSASFITVEEI